MNTHGTKLFLSLFLLSAIVIASLVIASPNTKADTWQVQQTDSQSVTNITSIDWRIEQNDSKTITGIESVSWRTQQTDSHTVTGVLVLAWRTQQNDSNYIRSVLSINATWTIVQNDSKQFASTNTTWITQQNDSIAIAGIVNATWWSQQEDSTTMVILRARFILQQTDTSTTTIPEITLRVTSTPITEVYVNTSYSYAWQIYSTNNPVSVSMEEGPSFLYCGANRLYGNASEVGNFTIALKFTDSQGDSVYQTYVLSVIEHSAPIEEPEDDDEFKIVTNDLLIWGVVVFIPIGIVFLFSMLTRNSRR